ncbi:MAG: L-threonylcarbamoyladenylate synthase [Prevotella sp.]|nr:L-threonylcarbamoyladenylate synthase [Prevotella sp.]MCM1074278.1 L-threonylcarbamoyladenylate synthase [Ruminococcus sp.]
MNTISFEDDILNALSVLRKGGLILYPTDTVWGIGCDATNPEAVSRIYALKHRRDSKSMLTLMHSPAMIERYVDEPQEIALDLIEQAVAPLTVIFDNAVGLAPNLIAQDRSVGIRVPKEKFCQTLLKAFRKPIVSTSANISGEPSVASFGEISQTIKEGVDYIVSYRQSDTATHAPSSVIKISKGGVFKILRK